MEYIDKKNTKYIVRSPKISDFERVKEICESRFGKGYISKSEFEKWVLDGDFCKVADYDGVVAGLVYLMPEETESLAKALKLDEEYIRNFANGKKVVHSRCAVLDKDFDQRGIMTTTHNEIFDNIKKAGFGAVFAPAWTYDGYTPMAKLLDKFGFEFLAIKQNIWYDIEGYTCIICNGKCKCDAAIYQKKF